jgi:hypothetical protein
MVASIIVRRDLVRGPPVGMMPTRKTFVVILAPHSPLRGSPVGTIPTRGICMGFVVPHYPVKGLPVSTRPPEAILVGIDVPSSLVRGFPVGTKPTRRMPVGIVARYEPNPRGTRKHPRASGGKVQGLPVGRILTRMLPVDIADPYRPARGLPGVARPARMVPVSGMEPRRLLCWHTTLVPERYSWASPNPMARNGGFLQPRDQAKRYSQASGAPHNLMRGSPART